MKSPRNIPLIILVFVLSACAGTNGGRAYPQLVEKVFTPVRKGVVTHQKPINAEEQRQYQLATVSIMKKFCKGKFKVISENTDSEIVGMDTSSVSSPLGYGSISNSYSTVDREDKLRIRFECPEDTSN